MRIRPVVLVLVLVFLVPVACAKPRGVTNEQKRNYVRTMRDETLPRFYEANPGLRAQVANAPGYAVFSNVSMKIMVVSTGHGYGIVVDRRTGRETFMRQITAGGGMGMGLKDMRGLFIFHSRGAMQSFIESGLEVGGQAEVAATADDMGVSAGTHAAASESGAAGTLGGRGGGTLAEGAGEGFSVYRLTEAGAAASVTLEGTKYYKDDSLN